MARQMAVPQPNLRGHSAMDIKAVILTGYLVSMALAAGLPSQASRPGTEAR